MPKAFDDCVKNGGRVRRLTGPNKKYGLKAGEYRNICFLNNKGYMGHTHKKEKK